MKAVIHQTFGHVFHFDAGALPLTKIDNAFMRNESTLAFEQDREMWIETSRDVVRT